MNFLSNAAQAVNEWIDANIKTEFRYNINLYDAMRYSLKAGGKRLRPALLIIAYDLVNGFSTDLKAHPALAYAAALELAHTYSLIHDDLPQMDNDDFRRGKPTNHKVFGEANAILAGDGLLTLAALTFATAKDEIPPHRKLSALALFLEAVGPLGMVGGQYIDMNFADFADSGRGELLETLHTQKTALFIAASLSCGALLAGGGDLEVDALSNYGKHIGLAFQIVDDILDIEGDPALTGKASLQDEKNKKLTYPYFFGIKRSKTIAEEHIWAAKEELKRLKRDTAILSELADYIYGRNA
ncbi:MAG: polyprenyl synthetase family protein [Deferribacteraceae bacterium]|jgi:geranylgeranyl diphosphate synthase type II|nr:polyprenyl synthetase family protein [Deferribacteraceae bacterium]